MFVYFQLIHVIIINLRYKKYLQNKGHGKDKSVSHKIHIFSCMMMFAKHVALNIYVDLPSITFSFSVISHGYHQIVKSILYCFWNNFFSNNCCFFVIQLVFDQIILCLCPGNPFKLKKNSYLFFVLLFIRIYNNTIRTPGMFMYKIKAWWSLYLPNDLMPC